MFCSEVYVKIKSFSIYAGTLPPLISVLLWIAVGICTAMLFFFPKPFGIRPFLVSVMLRSIYTLGLAPTLILLGAANVSMSLIQAPRYIQKALCTFLGSGRLPVVVLTK